MTISTLKSSLQVMKQATQIWDAIRHARWDDDEWFSITWMGTELDVNAYAHDGFMTFDVYAVDDGETIVFNKRKASLGTNDAKLLSFSIPHEICPGGNV